MLYEAFLLFSVVFAGAWVFDTLTESRHALKLRHVRQAWLFFLIGAYFIFFWCRNGQTLAMKTWQIRVVTLRGNGLSLKQAVIRYLLGWMLFLPALALSYLLQLRGWQSISVIGIGMVAWLSTAYMHRERQFLHDHLAGTRLVNVPKVAPNDTPKDANLPA